MKRVSQAEATRRYRNWHRLLGLCMTCPNPALFGYVYCAEHKNLVSKKSRRWYHNRISAGLCPRCGRRNKTSFVQCSLCREKDRLNWQRRQRFYRKVKAVEG